MQRKKIFDPVRLVQQKFERKNKHWRQIKIELINTSLVRWFVGRKPVEGISSSIGSFLYFVFFCSERANTKARGRSYRILFEGKLKAET